MEKIRYRSYGAGRRLEIVTVRNLSENKMYLGRSYPSPIRYQYHSSVNTRKKTSSLAVRKWWNDPEMKRRRRVAKYRLYSAEGKVKSSLKKGFRWIKRKCIMIVRRL
ncbi:hypothetical protein FH972_006682 [Carpinus fangiana]|uniref:DUF3511 domain-containing protein n=1 Tax=Carpinus fangiana TaxID=176857 RepID=A0A5N6QVH0_9ROSI|nr:hypothetical protein FH972_006682 [Carpinus fangiana]